MNEREKEFSKPSKLTNAGIQAVHVNAAREMVKLHTRERFPQSKMPNAKLDPSNSLASKSPGVTNVTVPAISHNGNCDNPQCAHCGQVIIPSPKSSYPIKDEPSITVSDWSIFTVKRPILNSQELDELSKSRFTFPLPEMIFGNSRVRIVNDKTNEFIEFNTLDALDSLDPDCNLKVSYHQEWLKARRSSTSSASEKSEKALKENSTIDMKKLTDNLDTLEPYDWTYSPNYNGTTNIKFEPTESKIPIDRLLRPDPILFFDESVLYEDELGDNGISVLSIKVRVMPTCMLLLSRFFLRIDDVIFRVRDTRVFIDFDTNNVIRETKLQEGLYNDLMLKAKGLNDPKKLFRDANWVSQNIPVIKCFTDSNISTI